jgi:hypothetical protein
MLDSCEFSYEQELPNASGNFCRTGFVKLCRIGNDVACTAVICTRHRGCKCFRPYFNRRRCPCWSKS